jgi:SNF2 family DNA or RNA helicase
LETIAEQTHNENIPWLVELLGQKWHYDILVIDESSSFKSHSSKRWKSLRKVLGKIDRMVQLTGTPAPNNLMELWPQIYLLDKGKRLQNTRGKFLEKYCQLIGNPAWNQWAVKKDRVNAIYRAVRDVVLRMSSEVYIEMPDR